MLLKDILRGIEYVSDSDINPEIEDIVYDSRKAGNGNMFVCLSGTRLDGHSYASSAYKQGCRVFMVERFLSLPADAVQISVKNSRASLAVASDNFFRHPSGRITVIGITGTKGKTTTSHIVRGILNAAGIKCGIIGTVGAYYDDVRIDTVNTTPESYELNKIFDIMINNGCKACVIEVSSTGLMYHRVDCVEFDTAVFTNLSPDHIGTNEHKDYEDYTYWKSVLFEKCRKAVVNKDDPAYKNMLINCSAPVMTYGLKNADAVATDVNLYRTEGFLGISFDCNFKDEKYRVEAALPGLFNVYNVLAAICACTCLGVNVSKFSDVIRDVRVSGRAECIHVSDDYDVIIDYAHNGVSMKSMLDTIKSYPHNRIIVLYGSVGGRAQIRRQELGLVTGRECSLSVLTSDDPGYEDPNEIIKEIAGYIESVGGKYVAIPDRGEAVEYALGLMKKGDILLLAGKGHENYMKINGEYVPFSEKEHIAKFMERRDAR